ncbi:MAG: CAP domain-containing protein [Chitinophagaceae bacterium]|nr:MAG: CAP domain-containing protein [Chitinophagaceae bacterium]
MTSEKIFTPFFSILLLAITIVLSSYNWSKSENISQDVLSYTNKFRKANGLTPLVSNDILTNVAQKHSEDMAAGRVRFGHDGFAKRNAAVARQMTIRSFAENVAFGASTGEAVVDMWKGSPGHRKNMLGKFRQIGIGVAKDKQGRVFYTQVFSD